MSKFWLLHPWFISLQFLVLMPSFIQEDMQSSGFSQTALLDFKRPRAGAAPPLACADETGEELHRD